MSVSTHESGRLVLSGGDGPADSARVRAALVHAVGGYLRNPVREAAVTCRVCTAPVGGYQYCWRCAQHQRLGHLADLVVPLTYAVADTPSAALVRRYKNDPARSIREQHSRVINQLLWLAITRHERCIGLAVGIPVSLRLVIPSLTSRPGVHPLTAIAASMNAVGPTALAPGPDMLCDRTVRPDKFILQPGGRLDGAHVLVLDDTWTTGSNAQSAALTLRGGGAAAVSVMVVGRWLSPDYAPAARFIETRLQRDYEPGICPVTGAQCPSVDGRGRLGAA